MQFNGRPIAVQFNETSITRSFLNEKKYIYSTSNMIVPKATTLRGLPLPHLSLSSADNEIREAI